MNRITKKFTELKTKNKKALIPYVTVGDPSLEMTVPILQQLVKSGADILEVGAAFSDPVADGTVIQAAHQRALKAGSTLNKLFDTVSEFRKTDQTTPIILMSYMNPIETMGYDIFLKKAKQSGIDAVLAVDLPPEEGKDLITVLKADDIAPIFFIAPTTSTERVKSTTSAASGFLYVVSLKGVTGSSVLDVSEVEKQVQRIRQYTDLPLAIGFGIQDGKSAAAVAKFADAVIVGKAYVSILEEFGSDKVLLLNKLADFTKELREAMD